MWKGVIALVERLYVLQRPKPGSQAWLIITERRFGGYVSGVPRHNASPRDPRPLEKLRAGGMIGGDRMSRAHQNYAKIYALHLKRFVDRTSTVTLVEVGVLNGTGIAMWSNLFPSGRIIGLDIDLVNVINNMDRLKASGAFKNRKVELYQFDQFEDNSRLLSSILDGDQIDVVIDDGAHFANSIVTTLSSMLPFLAADFSYFIEDNSQIHSILEVKFPHFEIYSYGKMTVLRPGS